MGRRTTNMRLSETLSVFVDGFLMNCSNGAHCKSLIHLGDQSNVGLKLKCCLLL
ncbi:hypothetical protein Scep_017164 [Stephania cephalantha]|uniref:Uncharacterized protein n=1 Tax=Stephania cephalantha TaxID=152367 RepID=A0AAP0IQT6_9MAGN